MSVSTYRSFREFYPFYLSQHSHPVCRRLHVIGSTLVLLIIAATLITQQWWLLLAVPAVGYGFAWVGHFGFEHNRPATFQHPWYSLMGDWVMFWQIVSGTLPQEAPGEQRRA